MKKKQMKRKGMRSIFMYESINNLINTFMIFVIKQLGQIMWKFDHYELSEFRSKYIKNTFYTKFFDFS